MISQNHIESTRPIRKPRNDWGEIRDLSYALCFETLRLVLLVSMTTVQVGIAFAEGVGTWLDKGMPELPELLEVGTEECNRKEEDSFEDKFEDSGFEGSGGEEKDLKDKRKTKNKKKKKTKARNQADQNTTSDYQDEELQYPKSTRNPPEIMASTGATPGSLTSSIDSVQPMTAMPMFYMPMPLPGTLGSPIFKGANITEFLECYEDLCSDYHVSAEDKVKRLPRYCVQPIAENIRFLKEWRNRDYIALKKVLLDDYRKDDIYQLLCSVHFLESYKNVLRTEEDNILDYCRKFDWIAEHCIEKGVVSQYTVAIWFLHGLPLSLAGKTIKKFAIDTKDPLTINYQDLLEYIIQRIASDKAFQYMNATQTPLQQAEVLDLLRQLSVH
jgi:hypothetical protein